MNVQTQTPRAARALPLAVAALLSLPAAALAHIDIDQAGSHMSRYGAQQIKQGPCGVTGGTRGEHVYTYEPGETITISMTEYVGHPGYFRIAFDDDGDDDFANPQTVDPINRECMPDPADKCGASDFYNNDTVLLDNLDPHDYPPLGSTPQYTWEVTLPDVECDNCTLQILQVMTDPPGIHAPYDPSYTSDDLYYQCIDLVLKRGTPAGGLDPTGMMMDPAGGGDPVDPNASGDPNAMGTAGDGTAQGTGGAITGGGSGGAGVPPANAPVGKSSSGGCAVSHRPGDRHGAPVGWFIATALLLGRVRRRSATGQRS